PYDVALLWGAVPANGLVDERVIANVTEFNQRYAYPRLLAARPEDFFRDVEHRYGPKLPVRRGDTGCYREDGAASTARELAHYRAAQLAARAAELLALWDERTEPTGSGAAERIERRAEQRRQMWRDVLRGPEGAGRRLGHDGNDWPAVDLPDGSALVVARDVPALGYVVPAESERAANPPQDEGAALEAQAGRFHVVLDPASGAIRS